MTWGARMGLAATLAILGAALILGVGALAGPGAQTALAAPCETCDPGGGGTGGTTYRSLTITVTGHGTVSESPLACTATTSPCSWNYAYLDTAQPSATPDAGYSFTGWSGACSGTGACSITMNANKSVSASFADMTPPPAPTITSPGASDPPPSGSAQSISFARSDSGGATGTSGFRCRIDNATFSGATTCTSPWGTGSLTTGTHTVYVWALDPAGNASGSTARSFKIVNRPDTSIGGSPANGSVVNSAMTAFTYSSSIAGSTYQCWLDGSPVTCDTNVGPVADGAHTLTAAAGISPLGDGTPYNDSTPAVRHWTVDTVAPDTSIDSGPPTVTSDPAASIGFSGTDPPPGTALHYECRLDAGDYTACTSPQSYSGLAAGAHTVSVRAVDAAGNVDGSPPSRSWTVIADADHDGVYTPSDCDDGNAGIHPGATDVPGDGIDQDCSGGDAAPAAAGGTVATGGGGTGGGPATTPPQTTGAQPLPPARGRLSKKWRVHGSKTVVRTLTLTRLARHAKVVVACTGHGCPFSSRRARVRHGKAALATMFGHRALRKGARIVLRISSPGRRTRVIHIVVRSSSPPRITG